MSRRRKAHPLPRVVLTVPASHPSERRFTQVKNALVRVSRTAAFARRAADVAVALAARLFVQRRVRAEDGSEAAQGARPYVGQLIRALFEVVGEGGDLHPQRLQLLALVPRLRDLRLKPRECHLAQ